MSAFTHFKRPIAGFGHSQQGRAMKPGCTQLTTLPADPAGATNIRVQIPNRQMSLTFEGTCFVRGFKGKPKAKPEPCWGVALKTTHPNSLEETPDKVMRNLQRNPAEACNYLLPLPCNKPWKNIRLVSHKERFGTPIADCHSHSSRRSASQPTSET